MDPSAAISELVECNAVGFASRVDVCDSFDFRDSHDLPGVDLLASAFAWVERSIPDGDTRAVGVVADGEYRGW